MEEEDVIELGSSDDESGPLPKKMKTVLPNAMVHIPSKLHGVTIKPVRAASPNVPKLFPGKNITVTKVANTVAANKSRHVNPAVPANRPVQKAMSKIAKRKVIRKSNLVPTKGTVLNPLSQIRKVIPQTVGIAIGSRLKAPIQILGPHPLQKLPPSVTVKKTGVALKPLANLILSKTAQKSNSVTKKGNVQLMPPVELDDAEVSTPSDNPQWYMTPEQSETSDQADQENINNKEPETPKYIEITIEDSPIKTTKTKRTRELSTENVITIEDSPNKVAQNNPDVEEGSDEDLNAITEVPKSKKKLQYRKESLETIAENRTLEIEIDPIAVDESLAIPINENKIITLTSDIMEVQESSVEIAQNQQGEVSVVQIKPTQSKENESLSSKDDDKNEFHPTYLNFIDLCFQLENSSDMKKIVEKKIKTYYRQVLKEFTQSEEFIDMVSSKIAAIKAAPEKMYLYIKDVVDELNVLRKQTKEVPAQEVKTNDEDILPFWKKECDSNKQRQIHKLDKTLKKLNRAIQKLEMQEVDFEDEEDSVYLLTEKYKERMVRVHAKFCQLTNSKMPSEPRLVIEPRPGCEPGPAKRLEAWINKKEALAFPDFHDVLRCVREANAEEKLGWNEAFIMEEARDLFVRCGKKLQRRRQEKEWKLATSRLAVVDDPAEKSDDLKKKLDDNRRLASTKETAVFNEFSDKQNRLKLEAEEIDDRDAEESPIESEEDDNDGSSALENKQKRKDRLRRLLQEQAKKSSNKSPNTEEKPSKDIANDVNTVEKKTDSLNEQQTNHDDNTIQSLNDSNDIGSDVDELHLLQKLHSDNEIHEITTSDSSSDSDTPIAISDNLESSSDECSKKEPAVDIISIENSSYSDDSDTPQGNTKTNKKPNVLSNNFEEVNMEIATSNSTGVDVERLENNTKYSGDISKDSSSKKYEISEKDNEMSILSESSEVCIDANNLKSPVERGDQKKQNSNLTPQIEKLSKYANTTNKSCENDGDDMTFEQFVSSNEQDVPVDNSKNSGETEQSIVHSDVLKTINGAPSTSTNYMHVDDSVDNSNSNMVTVIRECEDSPKESNSPHAEDGMNTMDKIQLNSAQVLLDSVSVIDSKESQSSLNEINLPSTSKSWPYFDNVAASSSVQFIEDVKSLLSNTNAPLDLLEGTVGTQSSNGTKDEKESYVCSSEQAMEITSSILITNVVSMRPSERSGDGPQENLNHVQNVETCSNESEMIVIGNSLDLPDLLQSGPSLPENIAEDKDDSSSADLFRNESDGRPISERAVNSVTSLLHTR